jgi:hypothetical protein
VRTGAMRGQSVVVGTSIENVDTGVLAVTSQRTLFSGSQKTVECKDSKLVGLQVYTDGIAIDVSNRQNASMFRVEDGPFVAAIINVFRDLGVFAYAEIGFLPHGARARDRIRLARGRVRAGGPLPRAGRRHGHWQRDDRRSGRAQPPRRRRGEATLALGATATEAIRAGAAPQPALGE